MDKLSQLLTQYHVDMLKEMARYQNIKMPKGNVGKTWLVNELTSTIVQNARSREYLSMISLPERATVGLVLQKGGKVKYQDLLKPLILSGIVYVEGQAGSEDLPSITMVFRALLSRGFLINITPSTGTNARVTFDAVQEVLLPLEVSSVLPRDLFSPPEVGIPQSNFALPAKVQHNDAELYLRKLFLMWAELRQLPAKRLKSGMLGKRDRTRLVQGLLNAGEEGDAQIEWLYMLLRQLDLLEETEESVSGTATPTALQFWESSSLLQYQKVIESYQKMTHEIEIDLANFPIYGQFYRRRTSDMRTGVINLIRELADIPWFSITLFGQLLNEGRIGRFIAFEQTLDTLNNYATWYTRNNEDLKIKLNRLENQVLTRILDELCLLGMVDLGYPDANASTPTRFHITELGRACLIPGSEPPVFAEPNGQVILQPDFQLLAIGPVQLSVLATLEWIATREKLGEGVITYRLTRESTYQTLQRGNTVEMVQAFLEKITMQPVPQNVARTLEEWGGQYERIVVRRNVTVLQVDRPELLADLFANPKIHPSLHRLDECTAWIHTTDVATVEKLLWDMQMLPTYSQGPKADLPHSMQWDDDVLRARHPLPSLYITGSICRVADESNGRWRLTAQSVQRAIAIGMAVNDIIALIEQMTGKPISHEWQKRIKSWGKHYGGGEVARVTLLRLESAQALLELRNADRRLSRWMRPLTKNEGLAVVEEKHYDEVREILSEWGVTITEQTWW